MMFERIIDENCIETTEPTVEKGLGFIDDEIVFQKEKVLKQEGNLYEIHHGTSAKYPKEYKTNNLYGTFSHGLFVDAWFEEYEKKRIADFSRMMQRHLDKTKILHALSAE